MPSIAVIADAHFHNLNGDFGLKPEEAERAIRRLADTVKATRVFNESSLALTYALDDIASRGIQHVVLLGDYSDDGQAATLERLGEVLDKYENRYGMRFYAVAGNHDIFASRGRHRSKRFIVKGGGYVLSTSNPAQSDPQADRTSLTTGMYCHGYPAGLEPFRHAGFFRRGDEIHWETPFGESDSPSSRLYEARSADAANMHQIMDASYLVEPFPGLWMLMIDANVFVPHGESTKSDGFSDSTDAGWNAMLTHKPFILEWMKNVAARAKISGKQLLAFSHYPALDPLRNTSDEEAALIGENTLTGRVPHIAVGDAFINAGIKVHFSGHLHINDTALHQNADGFVVNVSVPSLVSYPAAYKIISLSENYVEVDTVSIGEATLDPVITSSYRREIEETGVPAKRLMQAQDYGELLYEHIGHLVARRHLRREWPEDLAELIRTLTLADVAAVALMTTDDNEPDLTAPEALTILRSKYNADMAAWKEHANGILPGELEAIPLLAFVEDWYRMKMAGNLALKDIPAERQRAYSTISGLFDRNRENGLKSLQGRLALLISLFEKFTGLPCENFRVCTHSGAVTETLKA